MRSLLIVTALMFLPVVATQAKAETITIIVPSTAGGTTDRIARLVADAVAKQTDDTIVIINKPGAGGDIGTEEVANAAPDGNTLGIVFDFIATNHFVSDVSYDPFTSFDYITLLVSTPQVLISSTQLPYKSLDDLVNAAKSKPGEISFGAIGLGSTTLNAARLAEQAGIEVNAVPYSGGGGAFSADLMAGRVDYAMTSLPSAFPLIEGGKVRALAFGGEAPSKMLPGLPMLSETFPGMTATTWFGLIAPTGLAEEKIAELNQLFNDAIRSPELKKVLTDQGYDVIGTTPDEFEAKVREESARQEPIIQQIKSTMN